MDSESTFTLTGAIRVLTIRPPAAALMRRPPCRLDCPRPWPVAVYFKDINNIKRISVVMKDGQVVERDKLPLKRLLSVPRTTPRSTSQD